MSALCCYKTLRECQTSVSGGEQVQSRDSSFTDAAKWLVGGPCICNRQGSRLLMLTLWPHESPEKLEWKRFAARSGDDAPETAAREIRPRTRGTKRRRQQRVLGEKLPSATWASCMKAAIGSLGGARLASLRAR
jgi:hypothetical protein